MPKAWRERGWFSMLTAGSFLRGTTPLTRRCAPTSPARGEVRLRDRKFGLAVYSYIGLIAPPRFGGIVGHDGDQ